MKIVIIGGHLTPALALIDYIQRLPEQHQLVFVGRLYSQEKNKQQAQEQFEMQKRSVPFVALSSPRLDQKMNPLSWLQLALGLVGSFFSALQIIMRVRPKVCVSFGGYLAVPVTLAAWIWGVPVITHEQTRAPGEANRFIARFAKKIAVTFPETQSFFAGNKTVVTGNPVRPELFAAKPAKPSWLPEKLPSKPILYITGGNQGSQIINDVVAQNIGLIAKHWLVIHQCGQKTATTNYLQNLEKIREQLPNSLKQSYFPKEWMTTEELTWIYKHIAAAVSRSGANTVFEFAMLKIPSILVPLPFAHHQEQMKNAEWLAAAKGALLIPQKDFNPQSLLAALHKIESQRTNMRANLSHLDIKRDGAAALWQLIHSTV